MTKDAAHTEADGIDVAGEFPAVFCLVCMRHLPALMQHHCPSLNPTPDDKADKLAALADGYRRERDQWESPYHEAARQRDAFMAATQESGACAWVLPPWEGRGRGAPPINRKISDEISFSVTSHPHAR